MDQKEVFLDDRAIDELVYNGLMARGYTPGIEEVQSITDIFLELLISLELAYGQEDEK